MIALKYSLNFVRYTFLYEFSKNISFLSFTFCNIFVVYIFAYSVINKINNVIELTFN